MRQIAVAAVVIMVVPIAILALVGWWTWLTYTHSAEGTFGIALVDSYRMPTVTPAVE